MPCTSKELITQSNGLLRTAHTPSARRPLEATPRSHQRRMAGEYFLSTSTTPGPFDPGMSRSVKTTGRPADRRSPMGAGLLYADVHKIRFCVRARQRAPRGAVVRDLLLHV